LALQCLPLDGWPAKSSTLNKTIGMRLMRGDELRVKCHY
jgi:hypothetical protein